MFIILNLLNSFWFRIWPMIFPNIALGWNAIGLYVLSLILGLILNYVFGSIGRYRILKRLNVKQPLLSYIPIVSEYLDGKLAFKNRWLTALYSLILFLDFNWLFILPILQNLQYKYYFFKFNFEAKKVFPTILSLIMFSIYFIACHKIYKKLSDKYIIMTIFNILTFGLLGHVFMFAIRNNKFRNRDLLNKN